MLIIIDWLTFTLEKNEYFDIIRDLQLVTIMNDFKNKPGYWGYQYSMYYEGISILMNYNDSKVIVNFSGSGCRTFEDCSGLSWHDLFIYLKENNSKITRLDLAADDTQYLDIDRLASITNHFIDNDKRLVRTQFDYAEVYRSIKGVSITYGSAKSDIRIRIYDKGAERGFKPKEKTRLEIQLRRSLAQKAVELITTQEIGSIYSGIVNNYLGILAGSNNSKQRDHLDKNWLSFLETTKKIKIYSKVGREYNLPKLHTYIDKKLGNTISTYTQIVGTEPLIELLKDRQLNQKQKQLINRYNKK